MSSDRQSEIDLSDLPASVIAVLTTEHFALQTARSATISDTNGRTALYLGAVSSALVAIAFIGQASHFGGAFHIFGLTVLPALAFLGYATFERVIQTSVEDIAYARRINRIRRFYTDSSPFLANLLAAAEEATGAGVMRELGIRNLWWQNFVAVAGVVGAINSLILGGAVGLLVSWLTGSVVASSLAGAIGALAGFFVHVARQRAIWRRAEAGPLS